MLLSAGRRECAQTDSPRRNLPQANMPDSPFDSLQEIAETGDINESRRRVGEGSFEQNVIRLVLPAGREIKTHVAPGPMTLQCLEGRVAFTTMGKTLDLSAGQMLHLAAGEAHALRAVENSSLLLTLVLRR